MIFMTVVFSFIIWLTQSLRFVDMIVNRGLSVSDFLWLATLMLPRFLAVILPIACFVSVLYVYNKLISDRELMVMRAAGLSNLRLSLPAFALAGVTTIMVYTLNIYLLPASYQQFTDLKFAARSDYSSLLLQEGAFNTLPGKTTIFIRERGAAGQLKGILVHDASNPDKPVTLMAEQGALVQTAEGPRVVLINGTQQEFDRKKNRLSVGRFEKLTHDLNMTGKEAGRGRKKKPLEMFLWELFDPANHGDKRAKVLAEGHARLTSPLLSFDFVIISLAILLAGDFSRRGQASSIQISIGCVVAIQTFALGMRNLSDQGTFGIPFMYAAVLVPAIVGLILLSRKRRRPAGRAAPAGPS